jgi:hypothetical protein
MNELIRSLLTAVHGEHHDIATVAALYEWTWITKDTEESSILTAAERISKIGQRARRSQAISERSLFQINSQLPSRCGHQYS